MEGIHMIDVQDIVLKVKKDILLDHVSYQCQDGLIHGIVGRNGSGKTVLMKCICGFMRPVSGKIFINGIEIGKDVDFAPDTGVIIETPGFIPYYSGYQNLKILADIQGKISKKRIYQIMEQVGLNPKERKCVKKYSLGMRQRLGIAQALMEDQKLIILDEPFNGLDKEMVKDIRQILIKEKEKETTILLSSHNSDDIDLLCDRCYHLDAGKLA